MSTVVPAPPQRGMPPGLTQRQSAPYRRDMLCAATLVAIAAVAAICATHRLTPGEPECRVMRVLAIVGVAGSLISALAGGLLA